jgi:hypothetical protein
MELQNPMIIYDNNNNNFYPTPSFKLKENKDFLTYPLQQKFSKDGYPVYNFPYNPLNSSLIENFNNENTKTHFFFILCIIIFIFFIYFFKDYFF